MLFSRGQGGGVGTFKGKGNTYISFVGKEQRKPLEEITSPLMAELPCPQDVPFYGIGYRYPSNSEKSKCFRKTEHGTVGFQQGSALPPAPTAGVKSGGRQFAVYAI